MADQIREKIIFYVNSGNQLSSSSNSFTTTLTNLPGLNEYDSITTLQVAIPVSYWLVQVGENHMTLTENGISTIVSITPGNYNQQSFATVVSGILTAASPHGLTYTISFTNFFNQVQNGLYTYTVNTSAYPISFGFGPGVYVNEQFGFDAQSTVTFTAGSGTSTLVSANVCQFVPENTIYIHSNLVSRYDDILQDVYNQNSPPFGYIGWINPCPLEYSKKYVGGEGKIAVFSITDENGLPIYLNGANMSITFMIYKSNNFYDRALAFMKHLLVEMSSRIMGTSVSS